MSEEDSFRDLVRRARNGDPAAARELVEQYAPHIRRVVRVRLTDASLRRVMDSMDVCQSVLANFFVRMSVGQFDLNDPQDLVRLLVRMTQNKVLDHVRRQQADRRDRRREVGGGEVLEGLPDARTSPGEVAANRELLDLVHKRLTTEERYLAEQRAQGREWADLGRELGKTPESLRKQYSRALDRITQELGLDNSGILD